METTQTRASNVGDVSKEEMDKVEVEEVVVEDVGEERLLREVFKMGARAKIDIPMYEVNLDTEELLDSI